MRRALWEVPRTHGYLSKQAGSCCTKLLLKTGLFAIAKNRKSQHFDKVVLKEYKQDSQAPCLHKFPKNRAVGRNKKHNLQAPAEGEIERPVRPFPTQPLSLPQRDSTSKQYKYFCEELPSLQFSLLAINISFFLIPFFHN